MCSAAAIPCCHTALDRRSRSLSFKEPTYKILVQQFVEDTIITANSNLKINLGAEEVERMVLVHIDSTGWHKVKMSFKFKTASDLFLQLCFLQLTYN